LGKNAPDLIYPKTFSSNFVRFFNKKIYDQRLKKNETCNVYKKIQLGWGEEARKIGSKDALRL